MTRRFFITATGTNVGKTLVTTVLCHQLRAQGKTVCALKPVISGFDANDPGNDSALILKSCGVAPTPENIAAISPWRFAAPLAPNMASAKENKKIDVNALVSFCQKAQGDYAFVEGAGGVMAPLNETHTMLDWIAGLGWSVILVGGTYLGAISHTLTALGALNMAGIKPHALILSESENGVDSHETVATLQHFIPQIPVVKIPRLVTDDAMWKHVSDISWIGNV